jgi:hypothetical protein
MPSRANLFHGAFAFAGALLFLPQLFWADSPLYTQVLTEPVLVRLGAPLKLLFLFLGARYAWQCSRLFEPGNPVRPTWTLLSLGLGAFFFGQLTLSGYQLFLGQTPFPSPADAFFLLAYPPLIFGFVTALRAYEAAGYPVGTAAERWVLGLATAAGLSVVGVIVLRPILAAPASPIERFLNAAYPALDLVILVPVVLLLSVARRFRGGAVVEVWGAVLLGFLFLSAGDVFFAYSSSLGQGRLNALVHLAFLWAYIAISRGAIEQHRLLTV